MKLNNHKFLQWACYVSWVTVSYKMVNHSHVICTYYSITINFYISLFMNIKIVNKVHGFIKYHASLSIRFWVTCKIVHAVTHLSWSYLHGHRTKSTVDCTVLSCDRHSLMKWNSRLQRSLLFYYLVYLQAKTICFFWCLNTIVQEYEMLSCLLGRWTIKKWTKTNFFSFIQPRSLSSHWTFSDVWNTFLYILFALYFMLARIF